MGSKRKKRNENEKGGIHQSGSFRGKISSLKRKLSSLKEEICHNEKKADVFENTYREKNERGGTDATCKI